MTDPLTRHLAEQTLPGLADTARALAELLERHGGRVPPLLLARAALEIAEAGGRLQDLLGRLEAHAPPRRG